MYTAFCGNQVGALLVGFDDHCLMTNSSTKYSHTMLGALGCRTELHRDHLY